MNQNDNGTANRPFLQFHSLRFQLLSRSLLILAILLGLIGVLQYAFMRENIYRNTAASLHRQILSIASAQWEMMRSDSGEGRDWQSKPPFFFGPGTSLTFVDEGGGVSVLITARDTQPPQFSSEQINQMLNRHRRQPYLLTGSGADEHLAVAAPVIIESGQLLGTAIMASATQPLREMLWRHMLIFLALALGAMAIGLMAFRPVLRKTLVPLSNMVETAAHIDAGNLDRRFPAQQGQIEIDQLSDSFNGMLHRLETTFIAERETQEQMRRFIADASHELRTPLTSIHGFLEVLLRGAALQPEQLEEALKSMHSESQRLNKLVNDLLLLSKLDRMPRTAMEVGYLDESVREMEPQLRILAGSRSVVMTIQPGLTCRYDPDQIKQIILNLFQNAIQYTDPEDGQIRVSLLKHHEQIRLVVQDNGQGISPEHLTHIFERFYRSDSARTRREGGAGLGLAITKAIVETHGGSIDVSSRIGQGTTVLVILPETEMPLI